MQTKEPGQRGILVVIEGIDHAGKSSVVARLPSLLRNSGAEVVVCGELRSPIADLLRGRALRELSPFLKTYLFAADRAWTYENECIPALARGAVVLWDRYVDSAIVYRAVELSTQKSEIDLDFVREINSPFRQPDMTIYIDIDTKTSLTRVAGTDDSEPYDSKFLERVRAEYLALSVEKNYRMVNGMQDRETVAAEAAAAIRNFVRQFRRQPSV